MTRLVVKALSATGVQKGPIELPASLVICPWGESKDLDGNQVIVNETTVRDLPANQLATGFEEIALDFSHNTVPRFDAEGNPIPLPEPLPIAAMGVLTVEPGVGIVFTPASWTPQGERYYCGRHYRDLSPTVGKNEKGEVTFVHSVALTRAGQITGLHAYSAIPFLGGAGVRRGAPTPTTIMENTLDWRALLAGLLKLDPATATDEDIAAAAAKPLAAAPAEVKKDPEEEVTALSAVNARLDQIDRDNIVSAATLAGKVIPLSADEITTTPVATLRAMCARIQPTVKLGTGTEVKQAGADLQPLSAEEKNAARLLGISEADYLKGNA